MADWRLLPAIIVVEVLSYLPLTDRLCSSSSCKSWRNCLFYPSLWQSIDYYFTRNGRKRAKLLTQRCGHFVKNCTIGFDPRNISDLRGMISLLQKLSRNPLLERLTLKPTSFRILWSDAVNGSSRQTSRTSTSSSSSLRTSSGRSQSSHSNLNYTCREGSQNAFVELVHQICHRAARLKHLSLGCIEELADHRESILVALLSALRTTGRCGSVEAKNGGSDESHAFSHLVSLHVNSVKEDPEGYGFATGDSPRSTARLPRLLNGLPVLQYLSVDSEDVSEDLLLRLAANGRARLRRLSITIHQPSPRTDSGVDGAPVASGVHNATWATVRHACPDLRVTLNLLHCFEGARHLLADVLRPAMPLAHFRSLFCGHVNAAAVTFMARHYGATLETVTVIEGLDGHVPMFYDAETEEDPFVMLAWKCNRLRSFTLIGVAILADDVVAIARLRGRQLESFIIPDCCLMFVRDAEEPDYGSQLNPTFRQQVSESLGYGWHPLEYEELHSAVKSECADADTAYLDLLLSDHALNETTHGQLATSGIQFGGGATIVVPAANATQS